MEENKTDNENNIYRNLLLLKPVYNIDLFTDIPKDKNINSKNIYLKFYNEHTKKKFYIMKIIQYVPIVIMNKI